MTTAAERFIESVREAWDNADCYADTAALGLSATDEDALRGLCGETGEDYHAAEADVMEFVRRKAS